MAKHAHRKSKDELAAERLAEAIADGHVVPFEGSWAKGTVGPYQSALGPASFAVFIDRGAPRHGVFAGRREYPSAAHAAASVVGLIGSTNTIDALRSLRARGVAYEDLRTPLRLARRNPTTYARKLPSPFDRFTARDWALVRSAAKNLGNYDDEAVVTSQGYVAVATGAPSEGAFLSGFHVNLPEYEWPPAVRRRASTKRPGARKRTRKVHQRSNPRHNTPRNTSHTRGGAGRCR